MAVIAPIVRHAAHWLRDGGLLAVEHDDTTSERTAALIGATGVFAEVTAHRDLAGRERFVTARRSGGQERSDRGIGAGGQERSDRGLAPAGRSAATGDWRRRAGAQRTRPSCSTVATPPIGRGHHRRRLRSQKRPVRRHAHRHRVRHRCRRFDSQAVAALLAAKGRGRDMPVGVLVGSWHTIEGLVYYVPDNARELIRAFGRGR